MGGWRTLYAACFVVVVVVVVGASGYSSLLLLSLISISDKDLPCPLSSSLCGSIHLSPVTRPGLSSLIIHGAVHAVVALFDDGMCP
jgi:hypothetical protein